MVESKSEVPAGFFRNAKGRIVADKYKGVKKYRTTELCYREGRLVQPGEVVVLTDAKPSKTYEAIEDEAPKAAAPAPVAPKQVRASDKSV